MGTYTSMKRDMIAKQNAKFTRSATAVTCPPQTLKEFCRARILHLAIGLVLLVACLSLDVETIRRRLPGWTTTPGDSPAIPAFTEDGNLKPGIYKRSPAFIEGHIKIYKENCERK